jgi:hypothetical protein
MALQRSVTIESTVPDSRAIILVRFMKIATDTVTGITTREWHRTSIEPGGGIDGTFDGAIAHIAIPGISVAEVARMKALARVAHTPAVIAAYLAFRNAQVRP